MSLTKIRAIVDIVEVTSKVYATLVDKSRAMLDKEARIKALEAEIADLKARR